MVDVTIRSVSSEPAGETSTYQDGFKQNEVGPSVSDPLVEVNTMPQNIMDVLGIEGNVRDLPSEEVERLNDIASFLNDELGKDGKVPTINTMGRKLDELRAELELDDQSESSVLLDRLGGVVKAWKNIGFIKNPAEKRALFMKLARCPDSKSMHKLVWREMDKLSW